MSKKKIVTKTASKSVYTTTQAAERLTNMLPERMVGKLTTRHQDLLAYDKTINANKGMFTLGNTITRAALVNTFSIDVDPSPKAVGTYKDLQTDNLTLVGAQRCINDVLNHNGLHIKSHDYYSEFVVCEKERTKRMVVLHSARIERLEARQGILEANVHNRVVVKKNHGKILRVFHSSGALVRPLNVRVKPSTLGSTNRTVKRVIQF